MSADSSQGKAAAATGTGITPFSTPQAWSHDTNPASRKRTHQTSCKRRSNGRKAKRDGWSKSSRHNCFRAVPVGSELFLHANRKLDAAVYPNLKADKLRIQSFDGGKGSASGCVAAAGSSRRRRRPAIGSRWRLRAAVSTVAVRDRRRRVCTSPASLWKLLTGPRYRNLELLRRPHMDGEVNNHQVSSAMQSDGTPFSSIRAMLTLLPLSLSTVRSTVVETGDSRGTSTWHFQSNVKLRRYST